MTALGGHEAFVEVTRLQIKELEIAIEHLKRSNRDIEAFLSEGGVEDKDLEDAIQENVSAIAAKSLRIAELQSALASAVQRGVRAADEKANNSTNNSEDQSRRRPHFEFNADRHLEEVTPRTLEDRGPGLSL
jgi:DNA-binding NarL/FixJ family response regulator